MATEPGGSHWPQARLCPIHRSRNAPLVGIVVQHPAIDAIHITSRLFTLLVTLANQFEQRFVQFRQIRDLRRPVVHLEIDVRRVFRVPRGEHLVVP